MNNFCFHKTGSIRVCLLFYTLMVLSTQGLAQAPSKVWDKRFGGSGTDQVQTVIQTSDGGYIVGGSSQSGAGGDKTQALLGTIDYWVVKMDATGNKQWDKTYGGSGAENLANILQTSDGGYLLFGSSNSGVGGDKTQASKGLEDYWLVKIDASGTKLWDKSYGGSGREDPVACRETTDGGYILGGTSNSPISGDKTQGTQGTEDYWVVKTDASGTKIWDFRFGGSNVDVLSDLRKTTDGGYILGGTSNSPISGDKTQGTQGLEDYWVVKITSTGTKSWDRRFGGTSSELCYNVIQTSDGGYLMTGASISGIGGDKTQASQGNYDYWLVKTNAAGAKVWDSRSGGTSSEEALFSGEMTDGGFVTIGYSLSGIGGDKTEASRGNNDYWLVKTNATGAKVWDKRFGGTSSDFMNSGSSYLTSDGGLIIAGTSVSGAGGDKTEGTQGGNDYWLLRLKFPDAPGGVYANNPLWLKADAGVTTGATFTWADMSSSSRNATQSTAGNQPTVAATSMNYNPAVTFDGTNDYLNISNSAGLPSGAAQVHGFGVARNLNTAGQYNTVFSYGISSTNSVFSLNKYAFNANTYLATNGADVLSSAGEFANNSTVLFDGKYTGTQGVLSSFGKQQAATSFVHNLTSANATVGAWLGGVDAWWNGNVSEVVLYSSNLTALEAQRVNSYLALKYGVTLDQTTPQNYLASDGTTILWNGTTNSTYKNNIAGIVRDDASALNQKQSKSANTGLQVAIGNGNTIAADNISNTNNFTVDKSALTWGDNASSVAAWTITGAPASHQILPRTWRVQETGTVGSVKVQIADNSGANGLPAESTTVYLLTDADGNFTSGATSTAMTLNGTNWEANVDLTNGQFFTFATEQTANAGTFAAAPACIDVKSVIAPTHNNNHNASFTQRYVLCNAQGIIMQVNTTPSFSTCGIGDFTVYAVNYPTNGVTNLTVGTDITALTGSPTNYDIKPISISVCKTNCGKFSSLIKQ